MRFASFAVVVSTCHCAAFVDPCTRLCQFDGPSVCTGGSWTKGDGICHGYYYNADGHCYHTTVTRKTCPSTGRAVRPYEVDGLMNRPRSHAVTTTMQPHTTAGMPITTTFAPNRAIQYTPMPITAADADLSKIADIEPEYVAMVREIIELHHFDLSQANIWSYSMELIQQGSRALQMAGGNEDPVALFKRLRGHLLLGVVGKTAPLLLHEALTMAMSVPVKEEDLKRFLAETGLSAFCKETSSLIRDIAIQFSWQVKPRDRLPTMEDVFREATAFSQIPKYCPEVVEEHPEIKVAVVAARAYRSLATETMIGGESAGLDLAGISRSSPFTDAAAHIMGRDPRTLRIPMRSVLFGNEIYTNRKNSVSEFLYLAGKEIFTTLFGESGHINPAGPLDLYEPAGRLLAMAVLNHVPLGVSLPATYLAELVGQLVSDAEMNRDFPALTRLIEEVLDGRTELVELNGEVIPVTTENREEVVASLLRNHFPTELYDRLELFIRGFHSVIPPFMLDNLSGEQLGEMILGSPQLTVDQLFESMNVIDFHAHDMQSQPVQWFREYLESASPEKYDRLMAIITGLYVLPARGIQVLLHPPFFKFQMTNGYNYQASIKMNGGVLVIPDFADREEMFRAFDEFLRPA